MNLLAIAVDGLAVESLKKGCTRERFISVLGIHGGIDWSCRHATVNFRKF